MSNQPDESGMDNDFDREPGWYDDDENPALRRHWNGWKWDAIEVKNPPKLPFWRELIDLFTKRRP
jgi:hypothetical protein